jgi:serine/threonine-protein kinase
MLSTLKGFLKILSILIVLALLGGLSAIVTMRILSYSKTVEVPDIKNKSLEQATELLDQKGLLLKVEALEYDVHNPPGYILRQAIAPGTQVKSGRSIMVTISKGAKIQAIPSFIGMPVSEAETLLLQGGMKINKKITAHSDTVEKDKIIAQTPAPGEPAQDEIDVIVSLGPQKIELTCPDFKPLSVAEAEKLAAKLGIKLEKQGTGAKIKWQRPEAGSPINVGDTVEINLEDVEVIKPMPGF